MLFNSWEFLCLVAVVLPLYYLPFPLAVRRLWQVLLLLAGSAVFYAWENPRLLILLFTSCAVNVLAVERILFWRLAAAGTGEGSPDSGDRPGSGPSCPRARRWLVGAVVANLGFLAFFKYAGFLTDLLPADWLPGGWRDWIRSIPLPVGISFYTFQGISLVVDVWRRDLSPKSTARLGRPGLRARFSAFRDLSFYISFFPQLVAGPIVKAHEFVDQIGEKSFRTIHWVTVRRGLILGYFLKIFVADNLAEQTASLTLGAEFLGNSGPLNLVPLLYGYSLQIFADFAGYSLIAVGLGALFGYRLPANFNFPYLSISITDFWRRWHLTLSAWLRDYLYIPLGGNRKGPGRTYVNLFLVMFLGGLWHGAEWKFAVWGIMHGVLLAAERFMARRRGKLSTPETFHPAIRTVRALVGWIYAFHAATLLWLTFMMPDMASIQAFFAGVGSGNWSLKGPPIFALMFYGSAAILYHGWGWLVEHREGLASRLNRPWLEAIVHGAMLFLVVTNPGAPRGFIYFQF